MFAEATERVRPHACTIETMNTGKMYLVIWIHTFGKVLKNLSCFGSDLK